MPHCLRKAFSALHIHGKLRLVSSPNSSTDSLRSLEQDGFQPDDDREMIMKPRSSMEVVEISDDEETRDPSVRGRRRRPVSISSASTSEASADLLQPPAQQSEYRNHSSKRVKVDTENFRHPILALGHQARRRASKSPSVTPLANGDFTRINLSFPNVDSGDKSVSLTFDNGPQASISLQGKPRMAAKTLINDRDAPEPSPSKPSQRKRQECPYYLDQKLDVKMYRGRGYDRFPVVLGTVKGHKALCDKWDAEQTENRRSLGNRDAVPNIDKTVVSSNSNPFSKEAETAEQQCLSQVIAIFPGIKREFVLDKYRAHHNAISDGNYQDVLQQPSAMEIIGEIAEVEDYPKEDGSKEVETGYPELADETGFTIIYDKEARKDELYLKKAIKLLAGEFSHVPTHKISKAVREKESLFDTYIYFTHTEAIFYNGTLHPYQRLKHPRMQLEKKYELGFGERKDGHQYLNLVNELQAAKQHVARETLRSNREKEKEEFEATNLAVHKAEGSIIECQCCFDGEVPINRAVSCEDDGGHFFCFSCIKGLAESQVGAMKHEMLCMDGTGCKASLSMEGVAKALTTRLFDKLAYYEQQAEISEAGIEGLEQCCHCDFKGICDPVEIDSVFICQNPDCGKNTCRKCNEDSHLPMTCAEAKKDKGISARHIVEEARSEAMMRKCPKCRTKIIKELGCNKMVCSCGGIMCYVCQANIAGGRDGGYQHFHHSGAKCPLYDAQGTERHDEDANEAEKNAIKKVKAQLGNEDLDEKLLQVETGPTTEKKRKVAAGPHIPPPLQDFRFFDGAEEGLQYDFQRDAPGARQFARMREAAHEATIAELGANHRDAVQQHIAAQQDLQQLRQREAELQPALQRVMQQARRDATRHVQAEQAEFQAHFDQLRQVFNLPNRFGAGMPPRLPGVFQPNLPAHRLFVPYQQPLNLGPPPPVGGAFGRQVDPEGMERWIGHLQPQHWQQHPFPR